MGDRYEYEFPEQYNWSLLDSVKLSALAETLAARCKFDLQTTTRNLTPGLRAALNEIAAMCDLESR